MSRRGRQPRSPARFPRTARVNQVLREVVAEAIEAASQEDERLELVTVTEIDTEADLRHATVYYTARREGAEEALEEQRVALQAEINRQTRLKRTPQLSFRPDPAVSSGWKIEEILKNLGSDDDRASDE